MPRTATALATPALLVWGRSSMGLSVEDVASRIGVAADRVASWEAGSAPPSMAQLKSLAQIYKRSLGAFYLATPPADFSVPTDHRRIPGAESAGVSPNLAVELRRAHDEREAAIELEGTDPDETPVEFRLRFAATSNVEEMAEAIRGALGVTIAMQLSWRDQYEAFNGWRDAIEQGGALVLQASRISLQEMRGMALHFDHLPVIVLNRADLPRGRLFSLLHELAHLVFGTEGLCDPISGDASEIEVLCNRVAAACLMPAVPFMEHALVRPRPNFSEDWSDEVLRRLSRDFGASEEAVLRRLLALSKTTERFYGRKRREYLERYARILARDTDAIVLPAQRKVGELGPRFVRLVLGALDRQSISLNEASGFMDTKIRHIDSLRAAVGS